jgi:nitrite reductase/ring-hydroxylating ferredoxin subunit
VSQAPTPLCRLDDIPDGQAKGFRMIVATPTGATKTDILIVRQGQRAYAYVNSCPHLGVTLDWRPDQFFDAEGVHLQCATHGALFEVQSGLCVAGPCRGQSLESVALTVADGAVFAGQ